MRVGLYGALIVASADALMLGPFDTWMLQDPSKIMNQAQAMAMAQAQAEKAGQACQETDDLYVRFPGRKDPIKVPQASISVENPKNMEATIFRRKPPETPGYHRPSLKTTKDCAGDSSSHDRHHHHDSHGKHSKHGSETGGDSEIGVKLVKRCVGSQLPMPVSHVQTQAGAASGQCACMNMSQAQQGPTVADGSKDIVLIDQSKHENDTNGGIAQKISPELTLGIANTLGRAFGIDMMPQGCPCGGGGSQPANYAGAPPIMGGPSVMGAHPIMRMPHIKVGFGLSQVSAERAEDDRNISFTEIESENKAADSDGGDCDCDCDCDALAQSEADQNFARFFMGQSQTDNEHFKMPEFPDKYDMQTLSQKFNLMDTMDPRGAALAQEVSSFTDNIVGNTLPQF